MQIIHIGRGVHNMWNNRIIFLFFMVWLPVIIVVNIILNNELNGFWFGVATGINLAVFLLWIIDCMYIYITKEREKKRWQN
jgi:hypothetical protein